MPACPECGAAVADGLDFCTSCGAPATDRADTSRDHTCPQCGAGVPADQLYCTACETTLEGETTDPAGRTCPDPGRAVSTDAAFCTGCGAAVEGTPSPHLSPADAESGAYVAADRLAKVESILDDDETVHYLTRGSTVDVEGSSAGTSLFGDDRSRRAERAGGCGPPSPTGGSR